MKRLLALPLAALALAFGATACGDDDATVTAPTAATAAAPAATAAPTTTAAPAVTASTLDVAKAIAALPDCPHVGDTIPDNFEQGCMAGGKLILGVAVLGYGACDVYVWGDDGLWAKNTDRLARDNWQGLTGPACDVP